MEKEAAKKTFEFIIDKIYNDFESRSCDTCKHFKDYQCEYHNFTPIHIFGQNTAETFCHKWELCEAVEDSD